jgi:predicted GNAT family N-acyltransferase
MAGGKFAKSLLEMVEKSGLDMSDAKMSKNNQTTLESIKQSLKGNGVNLTISEDEKQINLMKILVEESSRGKGKAKSAMRSIIDHADISGKSIVLSPTNEFGANKKRLTDFYKSLGFVENKGKNKNYEVSEEMYRDPKKKEFANLDMSESARMARAKEIGFNNPTLYHGTSTFKEGGNLFEEFQKFEGKDLTRSVSRSPVGKLGISLGEQPKVAEDFAYQASPADGEGAAMLPVMFRHNKIASINLDGKENNDEVYGAVIDAWKQGFDAIQFKNYTTPAGTKGSFVLVKEPNQIRSVNAAFDPKNKDSANLLASSATIGGIGAVSALSPKKSFADSLHETVMSAKPTTREIMDAQRKRENYLADIDARNKMNNSIRAPKSELALKLAGVSEKYNKARKELLPPGLDMVLPISELPADFLKKLSYAEDITMSDRIKAGAGLL